MITDCPRGLRISSVFVVLFFLAGCGGLSVNPKNPDEKKGYTVYAPMVVVNVSLTRTCKKPSPAGVCVEGEYFSNCTVSAPYVLPDYSKEFTVRFDKGIGSYSGTATIVNGWMFSSATSTGDPTKFLTDTAALVAAAIPAGEDAPQEGRDDVKCDEGIYKLNSDDGKFKKLFDIPWK